MSRHQGEDALLHEQQRTRVADLEARIAELEGLDEASFGAFTRWDWLVCVLGAVVLPALALWRCAG